MLCKIVTSTLQILYIYNVFTSGTISEKQHWKYLLNIFLGNLKFFKNISYIKIKIYLFII